MDNSIVDDNSECDLSESWTVVDNVPGQDSDTAPNGVTHAEGSDDDSLEVMHVEGEEKSTNNDADTDGISVISESEGCSDVEIVEHEGTVVNAIPKERKYVHCPNPYVNMWLSILMVMSLTATLGLGIGHYLGTQKYLVARDTIRHLQQENLDLERQLDDVSFQHYQCRKNLESTTKQPDAQLGHCSILDSLHYRDEGRNKSHSQDTSTVDRVDLVGPYQENGRDAPDTTNDLSEWNSTKGSNEAKMQNEKNLMDVRDNTQKILPSQPQKVLDDMKALPEEIKVPLSAGRDLVPQLKEKLVHLNAALKSWKKIISQELSMTSQNADKAKGQVEVILLARENETVAESKGEPAVVTVERELTPENRETKKRSFSDVWRKVRSNSLKVNAVSLLSSALYKFNTKSSQEELQDSKISQKDSECASASELSNFRNPVLGSFDKDTATDDDNNVRHFPSTDDISVSSVHNTIEVLLENSNVNIKDENDGAQMSIEGQTNGQDVRDPISNLYNTRNRNHHRYGKYINGGDDDYDDNSDHDDDDDFDENDDDFDDNGDREDGDYGHYKRYNKYKHDKYETGKRKKHYKNEKYFNKGKKQFVHRKNAERNFRKYVHAKPRHQHKITFQNKQTFSYISDNGNQIYKETFVGYQARRGQTHRGNKNEGVTWGKEHLGSNQNRSGAWLMKLYAGRAEHRRKNEKSDWLFNRALARKAKRDQEKRADWYFSRAHTRDICRLDHRPEWCKLYDQEDGYRSGRKGKQNDYKFRDEDSYQSGKNRKWNKNDDKYRKYKGREEDDRGNTKYFRKWKLKNLPRYWKGGKKIFSEAFLSAAKFFE